MDNDIFTWDIEIEELSKEEKETFVQRFNRTYYEALKEKAITEIPSLLTPSNFLGEAETYMANHNIPYDKKIRIQYAEAIYNDFASYIRA